MFYHFYSLHSSRAVEGNYIKRHEILPAHPSFCQQVGSPKTGEANRGKIRFKTKNLPDQAGEIQKKIPEKSPIVSLWESSWTAIQNVADYFSVNRPSSLLDISPRARL